MNSSVIKLQYLEDIRRVRNISDYNSLLLQIKVLYRFPEQTKFLLRYKDEEDDLVSVGSNLEFQEALTIQKKDNKLLKFFVEIDQTVATTFELPEYPIEENQPIFSEPVQNFHPNQDFKEDLIEEEFVPEPENEQDFEGYEDYVAVEGDLIGESLIDMYPNLAKSVEPVVEQEFEQPEPEPIADFVDMDVITKLREIERLSIDSKYGSSSESVPVNESNPFVFENMYKVDKLEVNDLSESCISNIEDLKSALENLKSMGFSDQQKNLNLLIKHQGEIVNVVKDLLEE